MNELKNIPLANIKAVIFDMDELMVDSAAVHDKIVEKVLHKYGGSLSVLTKEDESRWYGKRISEFLIYLHSKLDLGNLVTPQELYKEFKEIYLPIFAKEVPVMPGVVELIKYLQGKFRLAIASSAPREGIEKILTKLDSAKAFELIVSGEDDIVNGKPSPDIYLKTAEKLSLQPQECLVLEDAKNGVEAAKTAGMLAIGVHNQFTYQRLGLRQDLHVADLEVDDLNEVRDIFSLAA